MLERKRMLRNVGVGLSTFLLVSGLAACGDDDETESEPTVETDVDDDTAGESEETVDPSNLTATDVVPAIEVGEADQLPDVAESDMVVVDSVRLVGENELGSFWVARMNSDAEEDDQAVCMIHGIPEMGTDEIGTVGTVCHTPEHIYNNGLYASLNSQDAHGIDTYLLPPDVDGAAIRNQDGEPVDSIHLVERDGTQIVVRRIDAGEGPDEVISVPRGDGELVLDQL